MLINPNKKRLYYYLICVFFFVLAGFFQMIDSQLPEFWHALTSLMAHVILISLVAVWGISLIHRMVRNDLLSFFISIASMILFFLIVRMIKYGLTEEIDTLSRYMWYSYFIPQCLIPPTLLLSSLSIENKKGNTVSKKWYLLYIPALILIILIFTNDLHQCFFKLNFENGNFSYEHNLLFYFTLVWEIILILISLCVLFLKCRVSACKRKTWIPVSTFILCALISTVFFIANISAFKIPELLCFTCISVIESSIIIGLIPTNNDYEKFFNKSAYSGIITDENINIKYISENSPQVTKEMLEEAVKSPIITYDNIRFSSEKIQGGYIFKNEDLTKIIEINKELEKANNLILEKNHLISAENEIREQKTQIDEQNRIYNLIEKYTYNEFYELKKYLDEIYKDNNLSTIEFKDKMFYMCVLAAYIKRRSNLVMLSEKNKNLNIEELFFSIKESIDYLSLLNIESSLDFKVKGKIDSKILCDFYEFFEICVTDFDNMPNAIIVHLFKNDNDIIMLIESDANTDKLKLTCAKIKDKFSDICGKIKIKEDDVIYFTLVYPLGDNYEVC